jgi:serine/threonine protein kinase
MSETIADIHAKNVLIVDGNELNYLVANKDWKTVYFIDTDSYQTPNFPASAIMPSIQDFTRSDFSRDTDWFSFACVSFQFYTGIHPYKGIHPTIDNMIDRCKQHVSVFNSKVQYPPFVKLNSIPSDLSKWFYQVFEDGKRLPPPNMVGAIIKPTVTMVAFKSDMLTIDDYWDSPDNVLQGVTINGSPLFITENNYRFVNMNYSKHYDREFPIIVNNQLVHVSRDDQGIKFFNKVESRVDIPDVLRIGMVDNGIFVIIEGQLIELVMSEYTKQFQSTQSWSIMSEAMRFFTGCMHVDMFGKTQVYIPEHDGSVRLMHTVNIVKLDGHKVLDALYENKTFVAISGKQNKYYRTIVKFDSKMLIVAENQEEIDFQEINATVLANGMLVAVWGDNMEISAAGSVATKVVTGVHLTMQLAHDGSTVLGIEDKKIVTMRLK